MEHPGQAMMEEKKRVPGFPQDMWTTMDAEVASPETYGLVPGWTGAMMGMMTVVRVLPPDKYADIMKRIRENRTEPAPKPKMEHHDDGK